MTSIQQGKLKIDFCLHAEPVENINICMEKSYGIDTTWGDFKWKSIKFWQKIKLQDYYERSYEQVQLLHLNKLFEYIMILNYRHDILKLQSCVEKHSNLFGYLKQPSPMANSRCNSKPTFQSPIHLSWWIEEARRNWEHVLKKR